MIQAVQTSETSENSYQSTRRYSPEDGHLQLQLQFGFLKTDGSKQHVAEGTRTTPPATVLLPTLLFSCSDGLYKELRLSWVETTWSCRRLPYETGAHTELLYPQVHVQILRSYNLLMSRLYRLLGKDYVPRHLPTCAYSERRQTAMSAIVPDDVTRPSPVVGNASDFLAQQHDGAPSPGTRSPRRSTSLPRNSSRNDRQPLNHFAPDRSHATHSTRQRKVSAVSEEAESEDEAVQQQKSVKSRSQSKAHDSDEEIRGSDQGKTHSSQDSTFGDTGVAPSGLNVGTLPGHTSKGEEQSVRR
jgi:hypothetical protein